MRVSYLYMRLVRGYVIYAGGWYEGKSFVQEVCTRVSYLYTSTERCFAAMRGPKLYVPMDCIRKEMFYRSFQACSLGYSFGKYIQTVSILYVFFRFYVILMNEGF